MEDIISVLVEQMAQRASQSGSSVDPAEIERLKQQLAKARAAGKTPRPAPGRGAWFVPATAATAPARPAPPAAPKPVAPPLEPVADPMPALPVPTPQHHAAALLAAFGNRSALLGAMIFSEALAAPVALRQPR